MSGGLIFGRSPNLWLGFLLTVYAVIAYLGQFPADLSTLIVAAIGALVALVAGTDRVQIAAGDAAKGRQAGKGRRW